MLPYYHHRAVRLWIMSLLMLVVAMVFIGGVTRLTESGLSIVEWKLFSGVFPPMSAKGWEAEFSEYKASPEFHHKNSSFTVTEFKRIYWLEYIHRLLGRIIGLAFLLPFAYFLLKRALPAPLVQRMALATLLVGLQGTVGWVMVASGLVDAPRVNPLKLALHLTLALGLFCLLLWTYWQVSGRRRAPTHGTLLRPLLTFTSIALVVQIVLGALVAGSDAGLVYNTYPLMDGHVVPPSLREVWQHSDAWFAAPMIVQFVHRAGAHVVLLLVVLCWVIAARAPSPGQRAAGHAFGLSLCVQFALGVLTLLHAVPIALASAHQMAAMLVLSTLFNLRYLAAKPQAGCE